jgi:hypothetical protein
MKFIANDIKTWTPKDPEDIGLSEEERTYVNHAQKFDSFDEALAAAKRAAYHSGKKQDIKVIVAGINPVIERLETDFAVDPSVFKE